MFGGAAPDAMTAMIRILDTLHDENGDTVIPGVDSVDLGRRGDGGGSVYRDGSAILPGVDYLGTGSLSDRIWAKPSVTVLGMDLPNTAEASNVLLPEVTAKLSMRIVPGSDADAQLEALMAHLRAQRPWNCEVEVTKVKTGHAVRRRLVAPGDRRRERRRSSGRTASPVESIGSGASIPLVASLQKVAPDAAIILWGAEDTAKSRIHASDESVDPERDRTDDRRPGRVHRELRRFGALTGPAHGEPMPAHGTKRMTVLQAIVHRRRRDGRRRDLRAARRRRGRRGIGGVALVPHRRGDRRAAGILLRQARLHATRPPAACSPTSRRASARATSPASCRGCST